MTRRVLVLAAVGLALVAWALLASGGMPRDVGWGERAKEVGWDVLVGGERREVTNDLGEFKLDFTRGTCSAPSGGNRMSVIWGNWAKTTIPGDALSGSCTFKHALWPGMDALNLYVFGQLRINICDIALEIGGVVDPSGHPGQYGFRVGTGAAEEPAGFPVTVWTTVPTTPGEVVWVEIPIAVSVSGTTSVSTRNGTEIIGDKSNATHAKEKLAEDRWNSPDANHIVFTVNSVEAVLEQPGGAASTTIGATALDCDDWSDMAGTKYPMSIEDISFCGGTIDTSSFAPITWGETGASVNKLWMEGFGDGCIGFWCSEAFYNGDYVYNDIPNGVINAPYSLAVSAGLYYMDGTEVADTLLIECPCIRNIDSVTGEDLGGMQYTYGDWKDLSYKQLYGYAFWNTFSPDVIPPFKAYLDRTSAIAHGIEAGLGKAALKVEAAGYYAGAIYTEGMVSEVDGYYSIEGTHNGANYYSNGLYVCFCTDAGAGDWGIGPSLTVPPYYLQDGAGPAGVYLVNEDQYTDTVIDEETGQRQFSGLAGAGIGPAASTVTSGTVADAAVPSFQHDLTLEVDGWTLATPNRTAAPYVNNIASITHRGVGTSAYGVYNSHHDHTDWVGTNCTTPDAGGAFTVTAAGGSLKLTLDCDYTARQDVAQAPSCYHDRQATVDEGLWDWRGWGYLTQSFYVPAAVLANLPVADRDNPPAANYVTCTVAYYMDLDGISDNHLTGGDHEYTYAVGELHTLTRPIGIIDADLGGATEGWAGIVVDLLDDLPLARVESITWTFATAGAWTMQEPYLTVDTGDTQEPQALTPFHREAPATHGGALKVFENWRYAHGGFSGHWDGVFDRALYWPDDVKGNVVEKTAGFLNVVIGGSTGIDMTTCYSVEAAMGLVTACCNAWTGAFVEANSDAAWIDADLVALGVPACSDISPVMVGNANATYALPVCNRVASWSFERGLPYTFHVVKYFAGRGHGRALPATIPTDFPRARNLAVGKLYRQLLGTEPDAWVEREALTSDAQGHWESTYQAIRDADEKLYEYATTYQELGRLATREWAIAAAQVVAGRSCWLTLDAMGNPVWLACIEGATVTSYSIHDDSTWWQSPTVALSGTYRYPSLCVHDDGSLLAGATNTATNSIDVVRSRNLGTTWEAVDTAFGDDLQNGTLYCRNGCTYLAGWYDDHVYIVTTSAPDLTREVMDGTNSVLEVCAHAVGEGGAVPLCSVTMEDDGRILVAVASATDTAVYGCRNFRDGFSLLS